MSASPTTAHLFIVAPLLGQWRYWQSFLDASSDQGTDSSADRKGSGLVLEKSSSGSAVVAMVAWVGGLIFFAFVVAPIAFHRLASAHQAGLVVGGTLEILHWIGLIGGVIFYVATGYSVASCRGSGSGWLRHCKCHLRQSCLLLRLTRSSAFCRQWSGIGLQAGGEIETADSDQPRRWISSIFTSCRNGWRDLCCSAASELSWCWHANRSGRRRVKSRDMRI